jgi:hypothetical protein
MNDFEYPQFSLNSQNSSDSRAILDQLGADTKAMFYRAYESPPSIPDPDFIHDEEWLRERARQIRKVWDDGNRILRTTPDIYRHLRPIRPAAFDERLPFVVLLGDAGVGKSVTAFDLLLRYMFDDGGGFEWINVTNLLRRIRASFSKNSRKENEEVIINNIIRRDLVVLDDLGAEHVTDFGVSTVYTILNDRGERNARTIITSNLSLDKIAEKLDGRIASRLSRYGKVIEIKNHNVADPDPSQMPRDAVEHHAHREIVNNPCIAV